MIKVVLDTNVIVSGLNFPGSKPAKILELAASGNITNFISAPILKETKHILAKKFFWGLKGIEATEFWLKIFSKFVRPKIRISVIANKPDNRVLECAVEGEADYIISGDKHLLDLGTFREIEITTPADFLDLVVGLK